MLEQLYPVKLLEKNHFYALFLGFLYSILGIGIAVKLFPEDPAIVAVALIALMMYPTINKLMKQEESIESEKEEFNLFVFLKDHRHVYIIYMLFFVGILLAFALFALLLPTLATNHIFENQIGVMYGGNTGGATTGAATFQMGLFSKLLSNNFIVLLVILFSAFVLGEGGVFLIIWNASVWGTIFGNLAKTAALNVNLNPFVYFLLIAIIVTPHVLLEAFAYISSATTGGVISKALVYEKFFSKRFNFILINIFISFLFALVVLLIAVGVETFVLNNSDLYRTIIRQSFI